MPSREPKYGVELGFDDLNSQTPMSILYGVTSHDKYIPIAIDDTGRIQLGSGVTLNVDSLELGDVGIVGTDPVDSTDHKVAVDNLGAGNGFAIRSAIFSDGNRLHVNTDGTIDVNIAGTIPIVFTAVNQFASILVPSGVETTITSYTVPVGKTFEMTGIIGWGDYDGEFLIYVDGSPVGGGRTSASSRTLNLHYNEATIDATASQVVAVRVTHYSMGSETMKCNILGKLI